MKFHSSCMWYSPICAWVSSGVFSFYHWHFFTWSCMSICRYGHLFVCKSLLGNPGYRAVYKLYRRETNRPYNPCHCNVQKWLWKCVLKLEFFNIYVCTDILNLLLILCVCLRHIYALLFLYLYLLYPYSKKYDISRGGNNVVAHNIQSLPWEFS